MPVKAVPVEAAEEAGEPPKPAPEDPVTAETKDEDVPEKPAPKAKSRAKAKAKPTAKAAAKAAEKAEKAAEKAEKAQAASDKAAEKAKKEQEKVDMKARVKCPVCHRTVSQHCLLYTHKCSQAALDKKPKPPTVEEKFEKEVEPEPPEEDVPVAPKRAKKVVRYMPGDSDEEVTGPGAPKSFSDRLYERGDEEFLGYPKARVPPPPPLVRQQAYAGATPQAYQPYQPSYREQLIMRQRERQHQQALSQVAPIRRLFKR